MECCTRVVSLEGEEFTVRDAQQLIQPDTIAWFTVTPVALSSGTIKTFIRYREDPPRLRTLIRFAWNRRCELLSMLKLTRDGMYVVDFFEYYQAHLYFCGPDPDLERGARAVIDNLFSVSTLEVYRALTDAFKGRPGAKLTESLVDYASVCTNPTSLGLRFMVRTFPITALRLQFKGTGKARLSNAVLRDITDSKIHVTFCAKEHTKASQMYLQRLHEALPKNLLTVE